MRITISSVLRSFCDKCEQPCAEFNRRHEALAYAPAGGALGLEVVPLFDGQAGGTGHLCDACLKQLLAGLAGIAEGAATPPVVELQARTVELTTEVGALRQAIGAAELDVARLAKELNTSSDALERERAHAERWKKRAEGLAEDLRKRDSEVAYSPQAVTQQAEKLAKLQREEITKLQLDLSTQESRFAREWGGKLRVLQDELAALRRAQAA